MVDKTVDVDIDYDISGDEEVFILLQPDRPVICLSVCALSAVCLLGGRVACCRAFLREEEEQEEGALVDDLPLHDLVITDACMHVCMYE